MRLWVLSVSYTHLEAGKMNNMVKKLLTLNQLEFGNDKVSMERFDLTEVIRGVVQSAQLLAGQKEAELTFSQETPIYVWGDEFKVEEVVTNYVSNALNHVDYEKKIEVKAQKEGNVVRVSVFNTGDIIPKEDLEKVWIKFYKVDKARTREYGGSGIGLSIVKAIMDSMHQKCGVKNYENGVEFWFELSCADREDVYKRQGCGKTTVGRSLLHLYKPTSGDIFYNGQRVDEKSIQSMRKDMQMVFQDPYSSLNPRMTVEDIIGEPLDVHKLYTCLLYTSNIIVILHRQFAVIRIYRYTELLKKLSVAK